MNIAHIEEQSFIYGPGCRFVIWTQGCSIHCEGCWNQSMWNFEANIIMPVESLFQKILAEKDSVEGLTLLGGEPLDQYEDTLELLRQCWNTGMSTMLFTGYEMEEIHAKQMSAILDVTDILITGRYEEEKRTLESQWIGSTNQEIHFLSNRYKGYTQKDGNYVEISIEDTGGITILGFPDSTWSP
jgi:anaerobic ribonucleoside-triphosphate reductase activating protein